MLSLVVWLCSDWKRDGQDRAKSNLKYELTEKEIDAVGSALGLLHYYQLMDKTSRDISRDKLVAVFQNQCSFIPLFLAELLMMLCATLGSRGTHAGKHYPRMLIKRIFPR